MMRRGVIGLLPASCFALVVSSVSIGAQAEGVAESPNSAGAVSAVDSSNSVGAVSAADSSNSVGAVSAGDSPRVDHFLHNVWLKAQYLPSSGAMQPAEYGVESGTGARAGAAAGYAYRVAGSLSIGLGGSIQGIRIGDNGSDRYSYRSAYSFSLPFLLCFDPRLSQSLRLVMTAGLGYEHAWGNDSGMNRAWTGDGLTALAELGVAVRVLPRLEVLGSVGARGGVLNTKRFESNMGVFTWAAPLELGLRYSL